MQSIFFVMAIMGCGDGSAQCRQARIEPAQYTTVQQCQADMPRALARNTDLDYPVVSAACRASGPLIVRAGRAAARG